MPLVLVRPHPRRPGRAAGASARSPRRNFRSSPASAAATHDDVRQPRRRNGLRAGADQLSAGSRGADAAACLNAAERRRARRPARAVDRGKAGVAQPDQVMQQRGRLIRRIRKTEMIPALVDERARTARARRARRPALARARPSDRRRARRAAGCCGSTRSAIEQRAARRQPIGRRLVEILLLRVVQMVQTQRRHDEVDAEHPIPPVERGEVERARRARDRQTARAAPSPPRASTPSRRARSASRCGNASAALRRAGRRPLRARGSSAARRRQTARRRRAPRSSPDAAAPRPARWRDTSPNRLRSTCVMTHAPARSGALRPSSRRRARVGSPPDRAGAPRRGCAPTASRPCRRRSTGTAACRTIGPPSSSAVTRWTVAPVTRTPCSSAWRCASRPGKRRQQRRMDVEDAVGKRVEQRRPDQAHEAGEADQVDAARAAARRRARDRRRRGRRSRAG